MKREPDRSPHERPGIPRLQSWEGRQDTATPGMSLTWIRRAWRPQSTREDDPNLPLRVKVEINAHETAPVEPVIAGVAPVRTFTAPVRTFTDASAGRDARRLGLRWPRRPR